MLPILFFSRTWREKEAAFKREQESSKRKEELNEQLKQLQDEDKTLEKQTAPLRTELMQKESDRNRLRDSNAQTDSMLSGKVKDFERDTDQLHNINNQVEMYVRSNKQGEIEDVERKVRSLYSYPDSSSLLSSHPLTILL